MAYHGIGWSVLQALIDPGLLAPFGVSLAASPVPAGTTALVPSDPDRSLKYGAAIITPPA